MKIYLTNSGCVVEQENKFYALPDFWDEDSWDNLIRHEDLEAYLKKVIAKSSTAAADPMKDSKSLRAPIGNQEVWAAGVTYFRSRTARMEESKSAGGGDFYDRVYAADRPELFFKATPSRVAGHQGKVAIRKDASWSVPEPELTLLISPGGKIIGYTIGNDMSSRDIEGENPLYLPQAKVYNRSCALGPCILVSSTPLPATTGIRLEILRAGQETFSGATTLASLKRDPASLVEYLYRDNIFPNGSFLLTGTGIVPPDAFTLNLDDEIRISIDGIGTLINFVG
ncbi:MAG TPA: fumarylacetoacetate hydrolase family protein [Terriglobales bacterium]|jgi:2-dehydro-3-deoxy-D-arabinonate dehydratase